MDEYNKLIEDGFESTHDRDECAEMLKVIDEMPLFRIETSKGDGCSQLSMERVNIHVKVMYTDICYKTIGLVSASFW